jgi:hypothetical protein
MFNGRDLTGWNAPGKNWEIVSGTLFRARDGGSISFDAYPVPDDFELVFEWKVAPGSNSGVYYRPGQYEYQILDNKLHPDGRNPLSSAAALYAIAAPSEDATRPAGEWNEGRIVCRGTVIEHWLNGVRVVQLDYSRHPDADVRRQLAARGGSLGLQDHGDPVWYRNIRIKKLDP